MILSQSNFTDTEILNTPTDIINPYLSEVDEFYTDFCKGAGLTGQLIPIPFSCKRLCILFVHRRFFSDRLGIDVKEVQDGIIDHHMVKYKNAVEEYNDLYESALQALKGGSISDLKGGVTIRSFEFGI